MIDIKKVKEEATKEFVEEKMKDAKTKVKAKMKDLENAKKVVRNVEREMTELYETLGQ